MEKIEKKVVVLGLGVTGFDVLYTFKKFNNKIIIVDDNINEETALKLKSDGFSYFTTEEMLKSNIEIIMIVKSPGIRYNHPLIVNNPTTKIVNDIEMAYVLIANTNIKIVAVTGTNGKTSTTTFITQLLNNAGYKAFSCGNIGVSPLKVLREEEKIDYLVMELSSFQLKAVDRFTPDYAFLLNIEPDHLDYHDDINEYIECKHKIVERGTKSNYFFINENLKFKAKNLTLLKNDFEMPEDLTPYLSGLNLENLKLVYQFAKVINISYETFMKTIKKTYSGLEHRCEFVKTINGVNYINDSKATNVAASSFAVQQYKNVILIVGGYDKKEDLTLLKPFLGNVKACVSYGANRKEFRFIEGVIETNDLQEAVLKAQSLSVSGDTILFSPCSASYDQYANFEARGNHFKEIVGEL